jgi:glycosyltransferase involved in cell wall biosynthesis
LIPSAPHVALLGAFHFPVPQGSQVYVAEQARALVQAGARVTLICYGGRALEPEPFDVVATAAWSAPGSHGAGPKLGKPIADLALLRTLIKEQRTRRFDAVLAHNAEAALVALLARRALGIPVVYVAHTLLGDELHVYGPRALGGLARSFGRNVDRNIARRADATIALSERAREYLAPWCRGPLALIPPGLIPDTPPGPGEVARVCARFDLEVDHYALYSGNLDAYQDIDDLLAAAALAPEVPVVIATHGPAADLPGVRLIAGCDANTMRALTHGASMAVCPRRTCAGFPIKLLNYMEARRAIVARVGIGGTLHHGRDAWLLPADADATTLAAALRQLHADPGLRADLGRGARAVLGEEHAWHKLATETLALLALIRDRTSRAAAARGPQTK